MTNNDKHKLWPKSTGKNSAAELTPLHGSAAAGFHRTPSRAPSRQPLGSGPSFPVNCRSQRLLSPRRQLVPGQGFGEKRRPP